MQSSALDPIYRHGARLAAYSTPARTIGVKWLIVVSNGHTTDRGKQCESASTCKNPLPQALAVKLVAATDANVWATVRVIFGIHAQRSEQRKWKMRARFRFRFAFSFVAIRHRKAKLGRTKRAPFTLPIDLQKMSLLFLFMTLRSHPCRAKLLNSQAPSHS